MVDRDQRREPGVGREGRREACSGLFDGIAVTVGQQIAKLTHIGCAVEVARDDHRPRPGGVGEVVQRRLGGGDAASPVGERVRVGRDRGDDVHTGDHRVEPHAGDLQPRRGDGGVSGCFAGDTAASGNRLHRPIPPAPGAGMSTE